MVRPCRVLLVEDHLEVQAVFRNILEQEGYAVSLAADGVAMRNALDRGEIDVMIVDVVLPGADNGLALADEAAARGVAVVLITGHHDYYEKVENSGHRHLFKPFRLEALVRLTTEALQDTKPQCKAGGKKFGPA